MNTVTFSEKNSYEDFRLVLSQKEIGEATPRINFVDVPYRDGVLDLTEAFGEVKYNNRVHTFSFSYIGSDANWQATVSAVNNYINGKKHRIFFERDYYWIGRCTVKSAASARGIREIVISCDCEPYKYKLAETVIYINATSRKIINDRKTVTPIVDVISGSPILSWIDKLTGASYSWALSGNGNKSVDLRLYEGENTLTVTGGNIRLTYREGSL